MKNKHTLALKTDYKNQFNRKVWITERRSDLEYYFDSRSLAHGQIEAQPCWSVVPRTSLWLIPSVNTPGFDGWYGIAGDHPTDVVPLNYFDGDIRKILQYFVKKWLHAAEKLKQGEDFADFRINRSEDRPTIGQLVEDRALRLERFVEAEDLWKGNITAIIPPTPPHEDEYKTD